VAMASKYAIWESINVGPRRIEWTNTSVVKKAVKSDSDWHTRVVGLMVAFEVVHAYGDYFVRKVRASCSNNLWKKGIHTHTPVTDSTEKRAKFKPRYVDKEWTEEGTILFS
jgi:hypothetical protein